MNGQLPEAVARFFAELDDPAVYEVRRGVPVLTPHDVVLRMDAQGNKVRHTVTEDDLPEWAEATARLEADKGVLPVITIGHRLMGAPGQPENAQPDVVGFERNFRVEPFLATKAVVCDQYIRREYLAEVRGMPFRSVEFFPGRTEIRATALLKRDPMLDMGMVAFEGGNQVADDDDKKPADDKPAGDTAPAVTPEEGANDGPAAMTPEEESQAAKFWAHFEKTQPYLAYARQCFEAQNPMTVQQPPAAPAATPPVDQARMQNDQQAIHFGRLEQRLAALEAENADLKKQRDLAECERMVTQLEAEGFSLDRGYEVGLLSNLGPDHREAHVAYARKHYTRSPIGAGFIDVPAGAGRGPLPQKLTREQSDAIAAIASKKGIGFEAAKAEVLGS